MNSLLGRRMAVVGTPQKRCECALFGYHELPHPPGVASKRTLRGRRSQCRNPNWTALETLIRDEVLGRFMWMGEIRLEDGKPLHAYKDRVSRRYLHLAEDGRIFVYAQDDRYRQIDVAPITFAIGD